jgi:prepilin peptidase CpaA
LLLQALSRGTLAVLLVAAALWDIRRRRIPNAINSAVLLAGLATAAQAGGWRQALSGLGAALLCLALLWWPWLGKRIGGGDVKLAAAAASAVGLSRIHEYLLGMAVAAGALALVCYGLSNASARRQISTNLKLLTLGILPEPPLHGDGARVSVPFGVAATLSALTIVLLGTALVRWP